MTPSNIATTLDRLKKAGIDLNTVKFFTDEQGRQWVGHLLATASTQETPAPVEAPKEKKGPGRPRYKLSEQDRVKILALSENKTYVEVGKMFNVAPSTICNIVKRSKQKNYAFIVGRGTKLQKRGEKVPA